MNRLRVASFTVHGTAAQSARWKQAAEAEGFTSAGRWLAAAADAHLKARARAGAPIPLAWRRGVFKVQLESGEERTVRGHVSPPFASYRGDSAGERARSGKLHRLVYLPTRHALATLGSYRECKALASELAPRWLREEEPARIVLP